MLMFAVLLVVALIYFQTLHCLKVSTITHVEEHRFIYLLSCILFRRDDVYSVSILYIPFMLCLYCMSFFCLHSSFLCESGDFWEIRAICNAANCEL